MHYKLFIIIISFFFILMPVFAISSQLHLQAICGVLIGGAIFTTLVSSLKISSDYLLFLCSKSSRLSPIAMPKNTSIVVMFTLLVLYPFSFFGFDKIVDNLYPINSALGVLLALVIFVKIIAHGVMSHKNKTAFSRARKPRLSKKLRSKSAVNPPLRRPSSAD